MINNTSLTKNNAAYFVNSAVTVGIMFGVGYLPVIEPLTPMGLQVAGIFAGLIYGWSTVGMIWPSILGIIALGMTEVTTVKGAFLSAFGHDTVLLVFFLLILASFMNQAGITEYMANWLISRKIAAGRPWILTFMVFLAAYVLSALVSIMAAIVITWAIFYNICEKFGYTSKDKYPKVVSVGVVYSALIGYQVFPFKPLAAIVIGTLNQVSGIEVDFLKYVIFMFILTMTSVVVYVLLCRFVFRVDVSAISKNEVALSNNIVLNSYQKISFGILIAYIVLILMPSALPEQLFISVILKQIGSTGLTALMVAILLFMNFTQACNINLAIYKGMQWDVFFLLAAAMSVSAALTADETGIKEFLISMLSPFLADLNPLAFVVIVLIGATIITNFANNMVTGMIFVPIVYSLSLELNINPAVITILLSFLLACAIATPAASPPAALLHGNKAWLTSKEAILYSSATVIMSIMIGIFLGIPLGNWFFA